MVHVIKPENRWVVRPRLSNEDCPYLYYPTNIWGCKHPAREADAACWEDKCPIKEGAE